jgi:hypothetical protein
MLMNKEEVNKDQEKNKPHQTDINMELLMKYHIHILIKEKFIQEPFKDRPVENH